MDARNDPPAIAGSAGGARTYSTGTTTVGDDADDGVVLATDRRASLGGRFVSNKRTVKVEQVHPTAAMTLSGSVGGRAYARQLRVQARLYETRRGEPMGMDALATAAGNALRGLPVSPLLGGVDAGGLRLFQLDAAGGVLEDRYAATGSGTQVAVGAIEGRYDPDAGVDVAAGLAADAVAAAVERDTASGNGLVLARVTADGVDLREYDTAGAVGEDEGVVN